jgi:hypothetical protein
LFGAAGTAVVQIMYNRIGAGWTTTVFSGICIAGIPLQVWVVMNAGKWRVKRREREERKRLNSE